MSATYAAAACARIYGGIEFACAMLALRAAFAVMSALRAVEQAGQAGGER